MRGLTVSSFLFVSLFCFTLNAQNPIEPQVSVDEANRAASAMPEASNDRDKIRIGPGDLVEVSLYGVADFKNESRISESGELSVPLVGSVNVRGLTIEEAQDKIGKALKDGGYFREPHVMILMRDFASQGISILGEVTKPGVYPAMSTRRLYDIISLAGGFGPKAGKTITITHRDRPDQPEKVILSGDQSKSMESNVAVYPGDTILVGRAGVVYVVGDVVRPGGFLMENSERMTVLEAVALAQGVNRTAALGSAKVIRRNAGHPEEVKIPLKSIMAAKSNDVDLMADDILFIPGSAAKGAAKRGMDSVIQIATSLAIFGVR
jgi:polysaccharide export outer membrane protein